MILKTSINTNALRIKQKVKVIIFTLLLTVMGMLIPNITKAETTENFKLLRIEWFNDYGRSDVRMDQGCENWNLTPQQIQIFFETTKPTIPETFSGFNNVSCSVNGELMLNGIRKVYNINMGGFGTWWSGLEEEEPEYFVCREGACREFVDSYPPEKPNQ